ncbi:MAG: invasion associated locus B family protein [Geminicoccaceae bacterium]|nr:invasion associated locus B family protein [Geminicoccaceae bacterium]
MTTPRTLTALCLFAALAPAAAWAQAQAPVPVPTAPGTGSNPALKVKETHGDWEVVCGRTTPAAVKDECFMAQGVNSRETNRAVMTAMVLKSEAKKEPVLRLTVPLGILLPRGLAFAIDGEEVGGVPFLYCLADGCVTQVTLDGATLGKLKAGKKATATVHQANDKPVSIPVSLNGFTAGYDAI